MSRNGVVTAFVHAVDAQQGRVKVEYRAIEDELLSTWAPVAAPMSGGSRGQLFMPEAGDECLVAFENGDFNFPYVVGFLWNGQHESPEEEAHNRVIVTPGGHQLRFEDKESDTRVILRSNGQHELTLEDPAAAPYARLKSNGGRELLLDDLPGFGKVELTSGRHKITLDDAPAGTMIKIDAGMGAVTITMNVTPQPSLSISCAGNTVDISGTAMNVTAPGNLSVTAAGTATVSVGGTATITAGGAANITAGGAATITAGGLASITASGLTVTSGVATFSGTVVASTVVTGAVVASTYTPGVGNLI
ncbi:MAG TPA: phage baseplate assembly protein V [Vicinamibacterales bacterium]